MKRISVIGAALSAAIVLGGIGSTSALAIPSYCVQAIEFNGKPGGEFGNDRCTAPQEALKAYVLLSHWREIPGTNVYCVQDTESAQARLPYENELCSMETSVPDDGRYTKVPGGRAYFQQQGKLALDATGKAVGASVLKTSAKEIKCTADTSVVESNETEGVATIKYTGCKEGAGNNCHTGATGNEIVAPVSTKIVSYIEKVGSTEKFDAGWLLAPRNAAGANELVFECTGVKVKLYGSVTGSITPESQSSSNFTVKFALNAAGENTIKTTTNELRARFGSGATEKATQTSEESLGNPEEVLILG